MSDRVKNGIINKMSEKPLGNQFERNEWILPTDINLVSLVQDKFQQRLIEAGWGKDESINLAVGFSEALINAIVHGNLEIKDKPENESWREAALKKQTSVPSQKSIHVNLNISSSGVAVVIKDEGEGFDWKKLNLSEVSLGSSGRGAMFMSGYYDSMKYNEKGNQVTLIKNKI